MCTMQSTILGTWDISMNNIEKFLKGGVRDLVMRICWGRVFNRGTTSAVDFKAYWNILARIGGHCGQGIWGRVQKARSESEGMR